MPTYSTSTVTATLVASTAYSALEIKTPATTGARIVKWWVELNSVTAGDKNVLVQIGLFSAAVTTNTGVTPARVDYGLSGLASQCTVGVNATAEGAGTFNASYEQHSISASAGMTFWEPDPYAWQVPASSFFRIRLTPGSALTSATATVGCTWTE
jgi:hypothetical protein